MLQEVDPVLLVRFDKPLSYEVLLIKFDLVCDHVQSCPIILISRE
jgi:hypothetical protein